MKPLHLETCQACKANAPRVSDDELAELMAAIPDWTPISEEHILKLRRSFQFTQYSDAMAFANRVAEIADQFGHHPDLLVQWGLVTVTWWTHKIRGLHRTDFIMAAKTDQLYLS